MRSNSSPRFFPNKLEVVDNLTTRKSGVDLNTHIKNIFVKISIYGGVATAFASTRIWISIHSCSSRRLRLSPIYEVFSLFFLLFGGVFGYRHSFILITCSYHINTAVYGFWTSSDSFVRDFEKC